MICWELSIPQIYPIIFYWVAESATTATVPYLRESDISYIAY